MSTADAIRLRGLTKRFGSVVAASDVSFEVGAGEIFGFMGHNGAGKTTTLRMLLGLTRPTAGSAEILGYDVASRPLEIRRRCGFLPASYALPGEMTAREFLHYVGAMFALPARTYEARTSALLDQFGLTSEASRKLRGFSTGMTQKVGLAQALINEPRVLLLDEPTSGLDPLGRHELLSLLRGLSREQGVTIMFSSHILSDVETLCRRVATLHHGRLVAYGDIDVLKRENAATTMDDLYLSLVRKASGT